MVWEILFLLLGIGSITYGTLVMRIGSGSRFFMVWYVLAALLFLLAWMAHLHVWSRLPGLVRIICVAAVLAAAAALLYFAYLVFSQFTREDQKEADYVVVLGAQVLPGGPSVSLRYRLDTALAYLNEHEKAVCIVSGGQGDNEPFSEAEGMRAYLVEKGLDPERIVMEDRSTNTAENFRFASAFFDAGTDMVAVVTNDFHMYRALRTARREGIQNAFGISAPSNRLFLANNVLREILALMVYAATGRL